MKQRALTSVICISLLLNLETTISAAEECHEETCIEVKADDENHLSITVKKVRPGGSSASVPKPTQSQINSMPAAESTTHRQPWIPWLPKPAVTSNTRPTATKKAKAPSSQRKRSNPKIKRIAGSKLAEQVSRMLPSGVILSQPTSTPVIREPVNFMTTIPPTFTTVLIVLEVPIIITLRAVYRWEFGDGNSMVSAGPGAPFPGALVTNRYAEPGDYQVELRVLWSGTWRAGTISAPIKGSITQRFERELTIHPAQTLFTR